jgi:hypothetical protein
VTLSRWSLAVDDGFASQMLIVCRYSSDMTNFEKTATVDVDDLEGASAELEAMHAEVEAADD